MFAEKAMTARQKLRLTVTMWPETVSRRRPTAAIQPTATPTTQATTRATRATRAEVAANMGRPQQASTARRRPATRATRTGPTPSLVTATTTKAGVATTTIPNFCELLKRDMYLKKQWKPRVETRITLV